MVDEHWEGGWGPTFAPVQRTLLAALRDGTLDPRGTFSETDLTARFDAPWVTLRGALERLADMGLVRFRDGDTVTFTALSRAEWSESSWQLVTWLESAVRTAAPALSDDAVERYRGLVDRARTAAAHRDPALDGAFSDTLRFWRDETPNRLMARQLTRSLERLRYGAGHVVPWDPFDGEVWFAASLRAALDRDGDAASRAVHALWTPWTAWLETADRFEWDVPDTGAVPFWAEWTPNDGWYDVLGAVRDGTLQRGETYPFRVLTRRFGVPARDLRPILRRLELMGLAAGVADDPTSVRITEPGITEWREAVQSLQAVHEASARMALPVLDEHEAAALEHLVDRARRQARTRDHAFTTTMLEFTHLYGRNTANRYVRASAGLTIARLAFILEHAPPFRQWDIDEYLDAVTVALSERTTAAAVVAGHGLDQHFASHIEDVTSRYDSMDS